MTVAGSAAWEVAHTTRYRYEKPVSLSFHRAMLVPRATAAQAPGGTAIDVTPTPRGLNRSEDYFGNQVSYFALEASHWDLTVAARSQVALAPGRIVDMPGSPSLAEVTRRIDAREAEADCAAIEFRVPSPLAPTNDTLADYARTCVSDNGPYLAGVERLMARIHEEFRYDPASTTVSTPIDEVFSKKHGVCQDFAHLMIGCLRSIGAAARYVSGYLVPSADVVGAQASHAWVAVYCPGIGWVDFDPTNAVRPMAGHITLAWGRDYSDVSPLRGVVFGGGAHAVDVEVVVSGVPQADA